MSNEEIMKALAEPFLASEIEWRLQHTNQDKTTGLAIPYIDSRAIQNRLDEVVGAFNWQNAFTEWHEKAQLCGISIYCEERKEWVTKYDGADNTDIEPVKGGLSDALKRAAVHWGIGRVLYSMTGIWVDVEQKGKSTVIKQNQQKKLDDAYNKAVEVYQSGSKAVTPPPAPSPKPPKQDAPKANDVSAGDGLPQNPPIGSGDKVTPFPELYTVTSAKKTDNGNGVSTTLEMTDPQGNAVRAYLRGEDPAIKNGARIKDLKLTEKKSSYGTYFVVDGYQVAA